MQPTTGKTNYDKTVFRNKFSKKTFRTKAFSEKPLKPFFEKTFYFHYNFPVFEQAATPKYEVAKHKYEAHRLILV